MLQLTIILEYQ